MHVEVTGRGPPLVLLHGWAMHGGIFRPLSEALAARHTLHIVDLPGHGASRDSAVPLETGALVAALAATLPRAHWLGWSLGGLVALELALRAPERACALTLIAASPRFVAAPDWPHAVPLALLERFERELLGDWRTALDRFLALECQGSERMRRELRALRRYAYERGEPAPSALVQGLRLLELCDRRAELARLACPTLWISGANDRLVPWQAMAAAAARSPAGRHLRIAGAGHAPFLGHPECVLAAFAAWDCASPA